MLKMGDYDHVLLCWGFLSQGHSIVCYCLLDMSIIVHSTHSVLFLFRIDADTYFVSHSPITVLCLSVCIIQHCLSSVIHPLSLFLFPLSRVWPYTVGCVRNYAVATEQKDEPSIAERHNQAQEFDFALAKLDSSVRRTGRITKVQLNRIFQDICKKGRQ